MYYIGIIITIVEYLTFVASKTTHFDTSSAGTALNIYVKSSNWTNFNEKDSIIKRDSNKLQIINKKANALLSDAFDYISSPSIETLQLDLADKRLYIDSSCFLTLQNLKNLEINSASVLLDPYSFYGLNNLTYLKIKLDNETSRHIGKILYQQLSLNKLELLDNHDSNICYSASKNVTVKLVQLRFTGGLFETLTLNSFGCFRNLQSITITGSNLMFLESGAFNGLIKLETVSITSNNKLTHIPSNLFNAQSLEIINLSNNSISTIDNEAFTIENNKLSLVNLSYNSLEIIEQGSFRNIKCHFIDLTQSGIIGIVDGAFNTSRINVIDLMGNQILRYNSLKWGINYTITLALIDIIKSDIATSSSHHHSQIFRVTTKLNYIHLKESSQCYLSENGVYKICKTKNKSIRSVTDISNFLSTPELQIQDNETSSIDNYAFKNLTIRTLKISSSFVDKFTISNNSFAGLPNLRVLEIETKRIFLKTPVFYNLQSLIALEVPLIEPQEIQCQSFSNLLSLEELVLVNYNTVDICYGLCYTINFSIKNLEYKNSVFTELRSMKLSCLKKLEHFAITNGKLNTLTSYSFYGLENIKSLDLSSNQLTHIHQNTFKVLINLDVFLLSHNNIILIDDKSFENKTLSILDLSYNELISINKFTFYGLKCKHLDISNNKLLSIENSAFSSMGLDIIYVYNNKQVLKNFSAWTVDEVNIQTDCFDEESFTICKKFNTLTSVNLITNRNDFVNYRLRIKTSNTKSRKLELPQKIYSIDRNAFKNSDINTNLETLICHQTGHVFTIYPESFEGLINLENLELNVGPIVLRAHLFDKLPSLKYLKIEVDETLQYLSQVLINLSNLKTLEVVGNHTIGICQNIYSHKIPHSLIDVRYTNGEMTNLQANSMTCMPQLEKLIIKYTQLKTIQAGAFKSMTNLKYLNLESNKITRIGKGTFDDLKCTDLHLSLNKIGIIENDSFKNSNIENIYLFTTGVTSVMKSSGISESTHIRIATDAEIERLIYFRKLGSLPFK